MNNDLNRRRIQEAKNNIIHSIPAGKLGFGTVFKATLAFYAAQLLVSAIVLGSIILGITLITVIFN